MTTVLLVGSTGTFRSQIGHALLDRGRSRKAARTTPQGWLNGRTTVREYVTTLARQP